MLPAATAVAAVLRAGERPTRGFWLGEPRRPRCRARLRRVAGRRPPSTGDLLILIAVALGAIGYAEGGALARELGGWRVICWAVLLSAPLTVPIGAGRRGRVGRARRTRDAWLGFAYVAVVSALLGFFPWYAGLARGGVAKIGQVQLVQPLLTLAWSAAAARRAHRSRPRYRRHRSRYLRASSATQRTRVTRSSRPPLVTSRPVSEAAALSTSPAGRSGTSTRSGEDRLLLVASDRISTYDVVHPTPIPDKGKVLTGLTGVLARAHRRGRARTT